MMQKMIKKMGTFVMASLICLVMPVYGFAAEDRKPGIVLEDKEIAAFGFVSDGELYLPVRVICEALGYDIQWMGKEKGISAQKSDMNIEVNLKDAKIKINDHEMYMMNNYKMINGRTYLHENFFSDNLGLKVQWDSPGGKVALIKTGENPITIITQKEFSETKTLKLTLQYPNISGLKDTGMQQKLNSIFKKLALDAKAEGLQNEKGITKDAVTRHIKAETFFNYQVEYNRNDILSVVFNNYQYSGGAHGLEIQSSYTFNLKTGIEYKLKDLFKDGTDYVPLISKEVKRQMKDREMTVLLTPFNSIKTNQDYYINNNALVVYFQEYEYLPYAFGIPEFAVEYSILGKSLIFDPDSLLLTK